MKDMTGKPVEQVKVEYYVARDGSGEYRKVINKWVVAQIVRGEESKQNRAWSGCIDWDQVTADDYEAAKAKVDKPEEKVEQTCLVADLLKRVEALERICVELHNKQ